MRTHVVVLKADLELNGLDEVPLLGLGPLEDLTDGLSHAWHRCEREAEAQSTGTVTMSVKWSSLPSLLPFPAVLSRSGHPALTDFAGERPTQRAQAATGICQTLHSCCTPVRSKHCPTAHLILTFLVVRGESEAGPASLRARAVAAPAQQGKLAAAGAA